ncbi:MAG: EAL domain-containing protein [Gammaproteobacteria bacterium]|nr:MAG: EAL domain-containing protein [Gammaproteobacteria bacterium]
MKHKEKVQDIPVAQSEAVQSQEFSQNEDNGLLPGQFRQYQTNLLYKQTQTELIVSLALTACVCMAFWDLAPAGVLLGWATVVNTMVGVRSLFIHKSAGKYRSDEIVAWGEFYTVTVFISGICWSSLTAITLKYGGTGMESFTLVVLLCISLTAYISMQSSPQAIAAFVVPAMLPMAAISMREFSVISSSLVVVVLVTTALMINSSRTLRDVLAKSFSLSNHNTNLIQKLVVAREAAEKAKKFAEDINLKLQSEIKVRMQAEKQIQASKQELSAILNNMQDIIYQIDEEGNVLWATPSVKDLLGYSLEEFREKNIRECYVEQNEFYRLKGELHAKNGILQNHTSEWVGKNGERIWISENSHYKYNNDREVIGIEGSARNITELKKTRDSLFEEKENAQVTLGSIADGVIRTNKEGYIEYMNETAEKALGCSSKDSCGKPLLEVFNIVNEKTQKTPPDPVKLSIEQGKSVMLPGYLQLIHPSHEDNLSIEVIASPIRDRDDDITGVVVVFHDVSGLRSLSKMTYQATHDSLTGLINRREFERRVSQALENARHNNGRYVLCYLDLDNFKVVNDTSGHIAGDELLKMLKLRFQSMMREADVLGRLGGDEFGILLAGCSVDWAVEVAENIRAMAEDFRFVWDNKAFRIGVSIGIVKISADSGMLTDVLRAADSACYMAKEKGRNRVHVYEENDKEMLERQGQMQWVQKIHDVLEQDRFRLFFQQIERLSGQPDRKEKIHGEVLLRVLDDDMKLVGPGSFIPSAERYNLMPMIDRWVIENTLKQLSGNLEKVVETMDTCCINLSGQSMSDERFTKFIIEHVQESRVPPHLLCFEITETAVIANLNTATSLISALREMGCRFALDDFGVGLSSFGYLRNLSIDYLKVDGSFVKNMVNNKIDYEMVRAINQIGHTMDIMTIAEFVEDEAILEAVRKLGVDYAQGYVISKPVPMEIALFSDSDATSPDDAMPTGLAAGVKATGL